MKRNKNNRGFTLVELVIAIAILAIAISPLIANFIQSSKLNLKGRKSLNAMNLAQDVMEGLSAYTPAELQEILEEMNEEVNEMTASGASDSEISNYCRDIMTDTVLPSGTAISGVSMTTEDVVDSSIGLTADGVIDKYVYKLKGVKAASSNYAEYDMVLTMDATDSDFDDYNGKQLADISEIDQYYDAVYTLQPSLEGEAIKDFITGSTKTATAADAYYGNLIRTVDIKIANAGTEDAPDYSVVVDTTYDVVSGKKAELGVEGDPPLTYSSGNICKSDKNVMPRSVYFYYEGIEGASYQNAPNYLDNIKVTNTTGNDVVVYLVRIQDKEYKDTNATYNTNYACKVDVTSSDMAGASTQNVSIVSNLRFDISKPLKENFRVTDEDGDTIAGVDTTAPNYYKNNRAVYTYNNIPVSESVYKSHIFDGYSFKKKNILFTVTMDMYEPASGGVGNVGTTKKVTTYTGGMSN